LLLQLDVAADATAAVNQLILLHVLVCAMFLHCCDFLGMQQPAIKYLIADCRQVSVHIQCGMILVKLWEIYVHLAGLHAWCNDTNSFLV